MPPKTLPKKKGATDDPPEVEIIGPFDDGNADGVADDAEQGRFAMAAPKSAEDNAGINGPLDDGNTDGVADDAE